MALAKNRQLFCGGLDRELTSDALRGAFTRFGEITDCFVATKKRGFGFVTFREPLSAASAQRSMNGQLLAGKKIQVCFARKRKTNEPQQPPAANASGGDKRRQPRSRGGSIQDGRRGGKPKGGGSRGRAPKEKASAAPPSGVALAKLACRVMGDSRPPHADAVYVVGEIDENQSPGLEAAIAAHRRYGCSVLFTGEDGTRCEGFSGGAAGRARLLSLAAGAVAPGCVRLVPFPPELDMIHTRVEAEALVRFAKAAGFRSVIVTAPPFHQLRAFATIVSVALEEYPTLQLWSWAGPAQPWGQEVRHSQGTTAGTRVGPRS